MHFVERVNGAYALRVSIRCIFSYAIDHDFYVSQTSNFGIMKLRTIFYQYLKEKQMIKAFKIMLGVLLKKRGHITHAIFIPSYIFYLLFQSCKELLLNFDLWRTLTQYIK